MSPSVTLSSANLTKLETFHTPFENAQRWMGKNTFQIVLLNDANIIGEHKETTMEMLYGCPFEKITFLPKIDTNFRFGRNWDTLWKRFNNGTFITLQMKVFGHKKIHLPCTGSKVSL